MEETHGYKIIIKEIDISLIGFWYLCIRWIWLFYYFHVMHVDDLNNYCNDNGMYENIFSKNFK